MTDNLKYVAEYLFTYKHIPSSPDFDTLYCDGLIPDTIKQFLSDKGILQDIEHLCYITINSIYDLMQCIGVVRDLSKQYLTPEIDIIIKECASSILHNLEVETSAKKCYSMWNKPELFNTPEDWESYRHLYDEYLAKHQVNLAVYSEFIILNAKHQIKSSPELFSTSSEYAV